MARFRLAGNSVVGQAERPLKGAERPTSALGVQLAFVTGGAEFQKGGNMGWMLLTDDEQGHIHHIMTTYRGQGDDLQDAVGALLIAKVYGWRVVRVMFSGKLYAKYQRILKLDFKEWCEPETGFAARHRGYQAALNVDSFWNLVRGDVPQPDGFAEVKKLFG